MNPRKHDLSCSRLWGQIFLSLFLGGVKSKIRSLRVIRWVVRRLHRSSVAECNRFKLTMSSIHINNTSIKVTDYILYLFNKCADKTDVIKANSRQQQMQSVLFKYSNLKEVVARLNAEADHCKCHLLLASSTYTSGATCLTCIHYNQDPPGQVHVTLPPLFSCLASCPCGICLYCPGISWCDLYE